MYYDAGSPQVQRQHFSWAEAYGIDVFICSWWGIDTNFDDKPVLFLYGFPLSLMSRDAWAQVVMNMRAQGYKFFISVDSYDMDIIQIFDGFHTYNPLYHAQVELRNIFELKYSKIDSVELCLKFN